MTHFRHLRIPALTGVLAIFVASCTASPGGCDLTLLERIDVDRTMAHIAYLSGQIGPRVVSTPQEREAAEYIARELSRYGYRVEIQEFPRASLHAYLTVQQPRQQELYIQVGSLRRGITVAEYPLLTPAGGITARVIDCGRGDAGAFPAEVSGQIALVIRSEQEPIEVIARAQQAGAVAVLLHNTDWRRYSVRVEEAGIPFATMNAEAAEVLRSSEEAIVNFQVNRYETSQNVIATRPLPGRPNETHPVVVFSAHYDSVPQSPGASDNASGTAGLIELARLFARVSLGVEIRFLACGGEEGGLVGSRYYVAQLPEQEQERIVANFNMDMIATAGPEQTTLFVNTLDGENLVARAALAAVDSLGYADLLRAPYQRGSSDHVPFANVGIPAANFIWREPETIALEPWYHHPYDTMERISSERLRIALEIIAAASVQVICPAGSIHSYH